MESPFATIPGLDLTQLGFATPDWERVLEWVQANATEEEYEAVWTRIVGEWLNRLAPGVSDKHRVYVGPVSVVTDLSPAKAAEIARLASSVVVRVEAWCPDLTLRERWEPFVIVTFSDDSRLYDYLSIFWPGDGEFGTASGVFINTGYTHILVNSNHVWDCDSIVVHEMVHALLHGRSLPAWAEEGFVQFVTGEFIPESRLLMNTELVRRHRVHWNDQTLAEFWSGEAFVAPESQELAYHLAHWLIYRVWCEHPDRFNPLIRSVSADDHGESGVRDAFGTGLNDFARSLVGVAFPPA